MPISKKLLVPNLFYKNLKVSKNGNYAATGISFISRKRRISSQIRFQLLLTVSASEPEPAV